MLRRIIPVSSGKGGVGKTTFAVNFALGMSRIAPTVLVDLDTGTSSVRNGIGVRVEKDLYHFLRKGATMAECITRLDSGYDPDGRFSNFGFVAGPRHFIQEISDPEPLLRRRLAQGIAGLPAEYVVLDLRAGLSSAVLDFLPYTNSGILIFTPHHRVATLAASDIVKAILFRSLRILFAKGSTFFELAEMERHYHRINDLVDRAEDVYEPSVPNLDSFVKELRELLGDHPVTRAIAATLESFRVFYVLNMFNGVEESYERAIVPLVENLSENVSSHINVTQLGWVVQDRQIHEATCSGRPVVLGGSGAKRRRSDGRELDPVMAELEQLESSMLGLRRRKRPRRRDSVFDLDPLDPDHLLSAQLETLMAMHGDRRQDSVGENFSHLVFRALNLMSPTMGAHEFGMTRIAAPERLLSWFLDRG